MLFLLYNFDFFQKYGEPFLYSRDHEACTKHESSNSPDGLQEIKTLTKMDYLFIVVFKTEQKLHKTKKSFHKSTNNNPPFHCPKTTLFHIYLRSVATNWIKTWPGKNRPFQIFDKSSNSLRNPPFILVIFS